MDIKKVGIGLLVGVLSLGAFAATASAHERCDRDGEYGRVERFEGRGFYGPRARFERERFERERFERERARERFEHRFEPTAHWYRR